MTFEPRSPREQLGPRLADLHGMKPPRPEVLARVERLLSQDRVLADAQLAAVKAAFRPQLPKK